MPAGPTHVDVPTFRGATREQYCARATYPSNLVPLSLVWKADLEPEVNPGSLNLDQVMTIFMTDLRKRRADFRGPGEGRVLLMQGAAEAGEAEGCFRTGIEIARSQGGKALELRATTSLARLLRDTNRRDEARTMLSEIYNWFTEGFDTADLKDAKALLDQLND